MVGCVAVMVAFSGAGLGGGLWRRGLEVHLCTLGRGRGGGATAALPPDMLALPLRTERAPPCRNGGVVRTARRRGCGSTRRVRGCSREGASPSPPGAAAVQKKRVSGTKTSGVHRLGGSQPDPEDTDRQTHHPDRRRGIRDTPKHPHEQHKRNIHTCAAPVLSGLTRRRAGTSVVAAVAAAAAVGRFASSPPSAVLYAARGAADRVGPKKSSS